MRLVTDIMNCYINFQSLHGYDLGRMFVVSPVHQNGSMNQLDNYLKKTCVLKCINKGKLEYEFTLKG